MEIWNEKAEERLKDNSRYDLKTIKLKPDTYNKLIRAKASLEFEKSELHSFDVFIDVLIENYLKSKEVMTNDPARMENR